jgi:hypothetical protein
MKRDNCINCPHTDNWEYPLCGCVYFWIYVQMNIDMLKQHPNYSIFIIKTNKYYFLIEYSIISGNIQNIFLNLEGIDILFIAL